MAQAAQHCRVPDLGPVFVAWEGKDSHRCPLETEGALDVVVFVFVHQGRNDPNHAPKACSQCGRTTLWEAEKFHVFCCKNCFRTAEISINMISSSKTTTKMKS